MPTTAIAINSKPTFANPRWNVARAKPGDQVELQVTATDLLPQQNVQFELRTEADLVLAQFAAGRDGKKKWMVPALPGPAKLHFLAILRETPRPENGHLNRLRHLKSAELEVQGARLAITSIDAAFVPKQEKLAVKFELTGEKPAQGRIEIWGERYPTDQPLYTEDFTPTAGTKEWKTWDGKSKDGKKHLNSQATNAYLTPEFSPYRVRIVAGPDAESVQDPCGKGAGKVIMAEAQFEVTFLSVHLRRQANLTEAAPAAKHRLADVLAIEPRSPAGAFVATDRLPLETEPVVNAGWAPSQPQAPQRPGVGRIRIPCVRHTIIGESLGQGLSSGGDPDLGGAWAARVADPYMGDNESPPDGPGGAGSTKHAIDRPIYTRPEIPIEIEARLKSKDPDKNKAPALGVFEKDAVGPVNLELHSDDVHLAHLYRQNLGDADPHRVYFTSAAMKVKRGKHDAPHHDGTNHPVISHWQARFEVTADDTQDFDVSTFDPDFRYDHTKDELRVYVNRTPLALAETDDEFDKAHKDYKRVDAKRVKLRKGLTRKGDVVWIVRIDSTATGSDQVSRWASGQPGPNCHVHYGGIRGLAATAELVGTLRANFSATGAGSEPIIGKANADFPYRDHVRLNPDSLSDVAQCERVESQAVTATGDQLGLAGVIFSPSTIAGDSYRIEAVVRGCPYTRDPGFVTARPHRPWAAGRTGRMSVWRLMTISSSRCPPRQGADGLDPSVGCDDPPLNRKAGDGLGMNTVLFNTIMQDAFNEWLVPVPSAPDAPGEPHKKIPTADYINAHNNLVQANLGGFTLNDAGAITQHFVIWPYYLYELPPNTDTNWPNAVSNAVLAAVNAHDTFCTPDDVKNEVDAAVGSKTLGDADDPLDGFFGGTPIPVSSLAADQFFDWIKGNVRAAAHDLLDEFTPQINPPISMQVVRWQEFFPNIWADGSGATQPIGTAGFCRGSGQALFFTIGGNPDTFEHEMTHSLHLCHFSTGSTTGSFWKHHDHEYPSCKQGYYNRTYDVPLPAGAVGPAITIDTGNRDRYCAKCALKLRGWNEEALPCNWSHPDVF